MLNPNKNGPFDRNISEYINVQIGTTLMHALVGNGANKGLAYSLKEYGAKDFNFVQYGGDIYFEVQR